MTDIDAALAARERYWDEHPIVTETAALPTRAVQDAIARVMRLARKGRGSIAFWADPLVGKSTCIKALTRAIRDRFPGAGILHLEAVEDKQQAEGRVLLDILKSIDYAPKIERELAGKRDQVSRALLAHSGPAKHLFLIIDEAQEITNQEFGWIKAVINKQVRLGIKTTIVLFGQRELRKRRDEIAQNGRSDLGKRFLGYLREFRGARSKADLDVICVAMDERSEYPEGSNLTYTEFLFPRAYSEGFRFTQVASLLWETITTGVAASDLRKGLPMEIVAAFIANVCIFCKDKDQKGFTVPPEVAKKALQSALAGDTQ